MTGTNGLVPEHISRTSSICSNTIAFTSCQVGNLDGLCAIRLFDAFAYAGLSVPKSYCSVAFKDLRAFTLTGCWIPYKWSCAFFSLFTLAKTISFVLYKFLLTVN